MYQVKLFHTSISNELLCEYINEWLRKNPQYKIINISYNLHRKRWSLFKIEYEALIVFTVPKLI